MKYFWEAEITFRVILSTIIHLQWLKTIWWFVLYGFYVLILRGHLHDNVFN